MASRRRVEELLREGRVTVNGVPARLGDSADPERDRVALDGRFLRAEPSAYWAVHKPRGMLSTRRDPQGRPTVLELLPREARKLRLFPVGRLDRDSEGLLLLTNDGSLAHVLLHPSLGSEREYRVRVRGEVGTQTVERLAGGIELEEGPTAPAEVEVTGYDGRRDATTLRMTLREGRKRQIRRALGALGHPVMRLVRVRMGPIRLGRLAPGKARALDAGERARLLAHARNLRADRSTAGRRASAADPESARRRTRSRRRSSSTNSSK